MKKILFLILAIGLISGCKSTAPMLKTAEAKYVSASSGTITMNSIGFGNNQSDAKTDAEKNAVDVLLFRGLPGSPQATPLISISESEAKTKYSDYFTSFYKNERYKTFITSSRPTSALQKNGKGKNSMYCDITVNLNSLRLDLEQQQVIRKFGY